MAYFTLVMQYYVIIKINAFKWHNLKVKTADMTSYLIFTEPNFIYLSLCQISRFHALTGQILPVKEVKLCRVMVDNSLHARARTQEERRG